MTTAESLFRATKHFVRCSSATGSISLPLTVSGVCVGAAGGAAGVDKVDCSSTKSITGRCWRWQSFSWPGRRGFTGSHGKGHRQSDEERNP
jgi:hypothetical protein